MWITKRNRWLLIVFALPLLIAAWIPRSSIPIFCSEESYKGRVVLITGASSGVGRGLAVEYAKRGASLIIVARRANELDETVRLCKGAPVVKAVTGDLASVEISNEVFKVVEEAFQGQLDLAIMNHAIVPEFLMEESPASYEKELRNVMEIDFFSIVRLTIALTPYLNRSAGKVIGIGTAGQYIPQLFLSAYTIAKNAVEGFYDHYRLEHRMLGSKLTVQFIVLGEISTEQLALKYKDSGFNSLIAVTTDDAVKNIMCVISRPLEQAYVPAPSIFAPVLEGMLRPLWDTMTWYYWVWPKIHMRERFLKVMKEFSEQL